VLRLHTSAYHDRVAISSELAWLSSLQSETTLVLPKPIVNKNGELVTGVPADSKPETLCTLMSWVEGKISPTVEILTDEQLAKVGSLMAQLHIHSQRNAFLQGYETVKSLPADYINLKQVFLCLAYLDNLSFLVANPEELAFVVGELPFAVEAFRNAVETVP